MKHIKLFENFEGPNIEIIMDKLSKSVGGYPFYKNNYTLWELALFSDYEEAKEFFDDNDEVIPATEEEFKNLQGEQGVNYPFNVFVRDWTTGDDEQSRYEEEKGKDVEYFISKYNVDLENALIMKELVDSL
jgi:hypothetical protein